uniref:Odorant receptor n=1 Tax=Phlebotomus papatasi TaxID=29031 RepID=A0A3F2ZEH6_PHLPP
MSVQQNMEIFNKIKPKIGLAITMATFYVTTEPLWQRVIIKASFISTALCPFCSILHIAKTFEGQFTGNLAMELMFFFACTQILSKSVLMRYHRKKLLELLNKVQSLHENLENEKLNSIAKNNLKTFSSIWVTCFKLLKAILNTMVFTFSITNAVKGKSGIFVPLPLIPTDFAYYTQIMLFVQFIFSSLAVMLAFYIDLCIAFFGFEIMAASDILYDYISTEKDLIQEDKDFLKNVTIRFCLVVNDIKTFNEIISISNFVQFVSSAFLIFAIFFFIRLYPRDPVGYILILALLVQLFLPCVFGEFIKTKMEKLSTIFYLTNWYDLSVKDQKSFLIIQGIFQRVYGIKAVGMYDVNIYTFITIVKMAASWCAFMFTLETTIEKAV